MKLEKSIKLQLIKFVSLLILFLLLLMIIISFFTIKKKYHDVTNNLSSELDNLYSSINNTISLTTSEIKESKENELKSFLENSARVCDNLIKSEIDVLYKNIKIISEKENIQNSIAFNLFKEKNIIKNQNEYIQKYVLSDKPIKFISLLNTEKTLAWPGRETRIGLEIFNSNGVIKARTDLKKEFREEDDSKEINAVLNTSLLPNVNKIISTEKGLAIKVYSRIINPNNYRSAGGLIGTFPIDNTFINHIKDSTNCEVIVFKNNGQYDTTTIYSGNEKYVFPDRAAIFFEIVNNPNKIIFEDMLIKTSSEDNPNDISFKTFKFLYYPIINDQHDIVGMLALGTRIDTFKNMINTLLKDEQNTFNKFRDSNNKMLGDIYENGQLILKSYIKIITIIMILGGFVVLILLNLYIKKIILINLDHLTTSIKYLSKNFDEFSPIESLKDDEFSVLISLFNEFLENFNQLKQRKAIAMHNIKDELQKLKNKSNENIDNITENSIKIDHIYNDIDKKRELYVLNYDSFIQNINFLKRNIDIKYENIQINKDLINSVFSKLIHSINNKNSNNTKEINQSEKLFLKYTEKLSEEIIEFERLNNDNYKQIINNINHFNEEVTSILLYLEKLEKVHKINNNIHYDYIKNIKQFTEEINEFKDTFK